MNKEPISIENLKKDLSQILNKKISRAWRGYGSALFLELGSLHNELAWNKDGTPAVSETGEWTLSSDGAWTLARESKELLNAEEAASVEIKKYCEEFQNLTISSLELDDNLTLILSNGFQLVINKADYGFFTLVANEKTYISYEDNAPYIQQKSI
jgi:hypothetical protein